MNRERLDGWGSMFRFITPILVTVAILILQQLRDEMKELRLGFSNHLSHHQEIEVLMESRLSSIETILKGGLKK